MPITPEEAIQKLKKLDSIKSITEEKLKDAQKELEVLQEQMQQDFGTTDINILQSQMQQEDAEIKKILLELESMSIFKTL